MTIVESVLAVGLAIGILMCWLGVFESFANGVNGEAIILLLVVFLSAVSLWAVFH